MLVSPSLLSADFYRLDKEIEMLNRSAAQWLHLDIMDGSFCPNISFGFPVIRAIQAHCTKVLDAHFMIVHPEHYVATAAEHNISVMTVHVEACDDLQSIISLIHQHGMKAGISLNPDTPLETIEEVLCDADMFLVMSVHPGFSGQHFIDSSIEKVKTLKALLTASNSEALIEVDGGIDYSNALTLRAAGADVIVCGDYIFKSADPLEVIERLAAIR